MGELSPIHWLIVLAIIVLLFGGKKIPEVMSGLGQGIRSFNDGLRAIVRGLARAIEDDIDDNFGAGSDGGPQHPIPVAGPVETKKAKKNPPEQEMSDQKRKVA